MEELLSADAQPFSDELFVTLLCFGQIVFAEVCHFPGMRTYAWPVALCNLSGGIS
jgi:hypothetical protein